MAAVVYQRDRNEWGPYWTSPNRYAEVLADCRKQASMGGSPEGFEKSFASLGLSYLKEKCPRLFDHFVGFQLIDKNEDSTKAFGVYGFRIGKKWFHVPIIFANDDIRGHEVFCSTEDQVIAPLKEAWIDALSSAENTRLGQGSQPNGQRLTSGGIDLRSLAFPQEVQHKFASWAQPFLPEAAQAITFRPKISQEWGWDLQAACEKSARTASAVLYMAERLPRIKEGLDQFYPGLADRLPDLTVRLHFPSMDRRYKAAFAPADEKEVAPTLYVFRTKHAGMSETELTGLKIKRYAIRDNRGDANKSVLVDNAGDHSTFGPDTNGLYDVIVGQGKIAKRICLTAMSGPTVREETVLVIDPESKKTQWCKLKDLNCVGKRPLKEYMDWVKKQSKSPPDGGRFLMLVETGWASKPMRRDRSLDGDRYVARYDEYDGDTPGPYGEQSPPLSLKQEPGTHTPNGLQNDPLTVGTDKAWVVTPDDREANRPTFLIGEIIVPKNVRYFSLKRDYDCVEDAGPVVEPNAYAATLRALHVKTADFKVAAYSGAWIVDSSKGRHEIPRHDLVPFLVETYGLAEKAAEEVEEVVTRRGAFQCRIKLADPMLERSLGNVGGGKTAPGDPGYTAGGEELAFGRYPSFTTQTDFSPMPVDYKDRKSLEDIMRPADADMDLKRVTNVAQQAAAGGYKQVFDVGMFSAIADFNAIDEESQRSIRKFTQTMTSAGKLYLMFCYHPEETQDRYGKTEAPQIRDALLKLNETAGDVALYLKDKKLKPVMQEDDEANVENLGEDA
jgi:hypothetical protein